MSQFSYRLWLTWQLTRHMGPRWIGRRALGAVQHRLGWWRWRTANCAWDAFGATDLFTDPHDGDPRRWSSEVSRPVRFLFDPHQLPQGRAPIGRESSGSLGGGVPWDMWDAGLACGDGPIAEAENLAAGQMKYFGHASLDIGMPPRWHKNPETGEELPAEMHWSDISDFAFGDIKVTWEASRFGWAYALVRAYHRTGRAEFAELFWQLLEDWRSHNQPYRGAHWKCGQEISLRMMAWIFAWYGLADAPSSTAARRGELVRMLAIATRRVAAHVRYALSQQNNHGISEGVGLWSVGLLFPELRGADRWERRGREILEQLATSLIDDDGSFSQHSWNYHRVMLQLYVWAIRLADANQRPFSDNLVSRVGRAAQLLHQMLELATGEVPMYGENDGALVLPLTNCDHQDYRPAVQAAYQVTRGAGCLPAGPWDEELFWLTGVLPKIEPGESQPQATHLSGSGGYVTLRLGALNVFTRCGGLSRRPSQADQLHLDLRWRGQEIAIDAGTYSYNGPPPWSRPFATTMCHNTVVVDGHDQMNPVSRFMWLPWIHGKSIAPRIARAQNVVYWRGTHDGFEHAPLHVSYAREVALLHPDGCVVIDRLRGQQVHTYRLQWLLADLPFQLNAEQGELVVQTPAGEYRLQIFHDCRPATIDVVRADPATPRGWRSRYYHERRPALSVVANVTAEATDFWSLFLPTDYGVHFQDDALQIDGPGHHGRLQYGDRQRKASLGAIQWGSAERSDWSTDEEVFTCDESINHPSEFC